MLDVLAKEVLPAYMHLARFLEVSYVPAGRDKPGIDALPDGAKYYQFLIKRTTTTNLTAAQIHQIGLDEVKKTKPRCWPSRRSLASRIWPVFAQR